ncbi:hypothetical protein Anas_06283, partial [Armadillidium nasatum]
CTSRFTHANRHCNDHPTAALKRTSETSLSGLVEAPECTEEVLRWLEKYKQEKEERTPAKNVKIKREFEGTPVTPLTPQTPLTPLSDSDFFTPPVKRTKSKRGLGPLMEQEQRNMRVISHHRSPHQIYSSQISHSLNDNSFCFTQSPPDVTHNYVDENFYGDVCLPKPIPTSPLQARVLRNTQNLQTPVKPCIYRSFDLEGIKPLSEDDDGGCLSYQHTHFTNSNKGNHNPDVTALASPAAYLRPPDQFLEEASPPKKTIVRETQSTDMYVYDDSQDSVTSDSLSDVVLSVPQITSNYNYENEHRDNNGSPIGKSSCNVVCDDSSKDTWRMRQPKKRWLQEAQREGNLDETPQKKVTNSLLYSARDFCTENSETKDKLMGAMALVQLGLHPNEVHEDTLQPLNLTTNRC